MTSNIKKLRIGIIGCGKVAEYHARFIRELGNASLVGVADVNRQAANEFAKRHNVPAAFGSIEELLDGAELDVLHVVTPPPYHYQTAKVALDRGVHVFIEKPVALTAHEAEDLFQRADLKGVQLCPDFIQLFHPRMQQLLDVVNSGRLGRALHVESYLCWNLDDSPELRESEGLHWSYRLPGGVLRDCSSHVLYLALCLAGAPRDVQVIQKSSGKLPQGLVDHLVIQIDGSQCTATAILSCQSKSSAYGVRVRCEHGSVEANFETQTLSVSGGGMLPRRLQAVTGTFTQGFSLATQTLGNVFNFLRGKLVPYNGLRILIPRYYESVQKSEAPPISRELALAATQVEAAVLAGPNQIQASGFYLPSSQKEVHQTERVLVTGASGYVGYRVVRALMEAGYYVRVLVRPTSSLERLQELGPEIFLGDVRRPSDVQAAVADMDVIVHLAAGMQGSTDYVVDSCVRGTKSVADVAQAMGVKRVIYMSSFSVYDFAALRNGEQITENSPLEAQPETRGAYTLGKRRAEDIALQHLRETTPAWTILRPSLIVGEGRDIFAAVGPKIGRNLISLSSPRKKLLLVHVDDVATAIVVCLQNPNTKNQVYTLSDQDELTVRDYVKTCIRRGAHKDIRTIYVPYVVARLLAATANLFHRVTPRVPGMNPRRLLSVYRNAGANSSLLCNHTGWQPEGRLLARLNGEVQSSSPVSPVEHDQIPVGQA